MTCSSINCKVFSFFSSELSFLFQGLIPTVNFPVLTLAYLKFSPNNCFLKLYFTICELICFYQPVNGSTVSSLFTFITRHRPYFTLTIRFIKCDLSVRDCVFPPCQFNFRHTYSSNISNVVLSVNDT